MDGGSQRRWIHPRIGDIDEYIRTGIGPSDTGRTWSEGENTFYMLLEVAHILEGIYWRTAQRSETAKAEFCTTACTYHIIPKDGMTLGEKSSKSVN